jgi:hypothetical protein
MTSISRNCIFAFMLCCIAAELRSQTPDIPSGMAPQGTFVKSRRVHESVFAAGIGLGLLTYSGDVDIGGTFTHGDFKWKPCLSASGQARIMSPARFVDVWLLLTGEYTTFEAVSDEYDFITTAFHPSAALKFEFFPTSPLRPFISGGAGMLFFKPDVTVKSPQVLARYPQFQGLSTSAFAVPITVGILWTLGRNFVFIYQFTKTLSFTDDLDGWSAEYNDNFQSFVIGVLYYL